MTTWNNFIKSEVGNTEKERKTQEMIKFCEFQFFFHFILFYFISFLFKKKKRRKDTNNMHQK